MKLYRLSWHNTEDNTIYGHTCWWPYRSKIIEVMKKLKGIFPQQTFSIESSTINQ